ncbi:flagellar biosynthetic protein FliO [Bosea sp. BIWAKO-01]|uniref:flagellar biosynthetic protein FliO n=1 Tax=Bosea sp. BIWAKO-01 TaxID=506668 RepID=UPI0008694EB7|nr:flagellar biosynthetic protein FliO [Bosea sp. BIWAKO-01]GAU84000.1 type VI alpha 3 procollagen protein [Bosea sp. BIWAKO-01]
MQTLFGFELSTGLRWIIAFAIVLILVALFAFLLRRITGGRLRIGGQGGGRARQPRLGVVDIHDLDRQRQLVLIRRDNVEHLVMIGGASDVVVETNIVRGSSSGRIAVPAQAEAPVFERPLAIDPALGFEALRADLQEETRRASPPPPPQPAAPLPDTLPPLPHRTPAPVSHVEPAVAPAGAAAAGMAGLAAGAAIVASQAPNFGRNQAPAPSVSSDELDDMARQLEEALKRPHSAVRSSQAPAIPVPDVVLPVTPPAPVKPEEPKPAAAAPVLAPVPTAPPPVFGRPVGVPPDVAAELEMALGLKPKPSDVVTPPVPAVEPKPAPFREPPEAAKLPEPAPVMHPAPTSAEHGERLSAKDEEDALEVSEDEADTEAEAEAAESEAAESGAEVEPGPEPSSVPAPEEPKAESKREEKPIQIDPFSVDAIEAEFARLLGRDPKSKS